MSIPAAAAALKIRRATPADAAECGRICYEAFGKIADQQNFPRELPAPEVGPMLVSMMFAHPKFFCVVAERGGRVIGSNCLDERNPVSGIGPITVDPAEQNSGAGRALMQAVIDRSNQQGFVAMRLVQAAYHMRSLSLYTKLSFVERETLARMQGPALATRTSGYTFRPATSADVASCDELCTHVHGHHRGGEVADAIAQGRATVAERNGTVVAYTTGFNYMGHTVAENNRDLIALLSNVELFDGPGFQVPVRNYDLFRWCLDHGFRVLQLNTLMTVGLYNEPQGAWLPSILY